MPSKNLLIGFGASALVLGAVGAIASGVDWDPRDVEASERYRQQERERAERYRGEAAGIEVSRADSSEQTARRSARADRREARRAARQAWWEETVDGATARFETDGVMGFLEDWRSWWLDEAEPAWSDWADRQEALVSDAERLADPAETIASEPAPTLLPRSVERILEESLAPEEMEAVRRSAGQASDWWAEERDRMRARRGNGGDR